MLGRERMKGIADRVLTAAKADQAEVIVTAIDGHLTRFAANAIHQNVSERNVTVRVRAVTDRRIGVASGNDLSDGGLRRLAGRAVRIAGLQRANPDFRSLPEPRPVPTVDAIVEQTANATPGDRAAAAAEVIECAIGEGLEAAGAVSTELEEIYVGNTLGVSAYHGRTAAAIVAVVMGADSSGYASDADLDLARLDPEGIGRAATEKAIRSRRPVSIEPGEYTVILEEDAVADMLFYLGYLGLGALSVQEGRSFLCGRLGEAVTGERITIWDDGLDPRGFVLPFDFEGVPKEKVVLIERGIARAAVHDTFTAGREEGARSTGHALPAPNPLGPIPVHLFLAPGDATKEEMVASTDRGIWVTRFHYTNPVHPVQAILTGMTRDGTFLIEDGAIAQPLRNLRFTQGILEAFAGAESIGRSLKTVKQDWGNFAVCAPAMKIRGFRFTGTTEF